MLRSGVGRVGLCGIGEGVGEVWQFNPFLTLVPNPILLNSVELLENFLCGGGWWCENVF